VQLKDIYPDLTFTADDDLFDQGMDRYISCLLLIGKKTETIRPVSVQQSSAVVSFLF
jgi:hypothetical protein